MEEAIKFARWIKDEKWRGFLLDSWILIDGNGNQQDVVKTTNELYIIYKRSLEPKTIPTNQIDLEDMIKDVEKKGK